MATTIQVRRAVAAVFALVNPILAAGEPGFETDTNKVKYGDGVTAWNDLPYQKSTASDITNFNTAVANAAPVSSVAGRTGNVTLQVNDVANAVAAPTYTTWAAQTPNVSFTITRNWTVAAHTSVNLLVAVATGAVQNLAATSINGINWTQRTLPANADWFKIVYGNNLFVAVARNSTTIATSPDGITWTQRTGSVSGEPRAVVYGAGLFVILFYGTSTASTSPDGITWTTRSLPVSGTWQAAAYGNNLFVAATYNSTVALTSSNGTSWTQRVVPSLNFQWAAAYGNGVFVIVGASGTMSSPDGITWTTAIGNERVSITFTGQKFVAAGNSLAYTSVDGAGWSVSSINLGNNWSTAVSLPNFNVFLIGGSFIAASFDQGVSWTIERLLQRFDPQAIVYANYKFVAVNQPNFAFTSVDGLNWTQNILPGGTNFCGLAYGNRTFVAISEGSNIAATSSDGLTWTQRTLPATANWRSIAYGNGLFVAVATGTITATSPDGITWTQRSILNGTWARVTYGGGLFVALSPSNSSTLLTSPDGITWTSRITGASYSITSVAYNRNASAFVGLTNNNTLFLHSTDGIYWTSYTKPAAFDPYPQNIAAGNGVFIAGAVNKIYVSTTGLTNDWTSLSLGSDALQNWSNIFYGNGRFLTGRYSATAPTLYSSASPVASRAEIADLIAVESPFQTSADIAAASPVKSVAGKTGVVTLAVTDVSGALNSDNYSTWSAQSLTNSAAYPAAAFGNGLFVLMGTSGTVALTSSDGINWTQRAVPSSNGWVSATYGNGIFVAVDSTNIAVTSPDGITWTQRTLPASRYWTGLAYGNGLFVATPGDGSNGSATSPDGITWTNRTLPTSNNWNTVIYENGLFVGINYNSNVIYTSSDGITWTSRTLPVSAEWYAVAYGNNTFVATANGGTIAATSPDGIVWTQRTLPISGHWRGISYGNGVFVAVGQINSSPFNGIVATSPNGITWTQRTISGQPAASTPWESIVYGNGVFVASNGNNNSVMTSTESVLSRNEILNLIASRFLHRNSSSVKTLLPNVAVQTCSLSASCTFTMPSAATSLPAFTLVLIQTGSFTGTFTGVKWPGNVAPTITTGANKVDVIRFVSDGTSWYGQITQNY